MMGPYCPGSFTSRNLKWAPENNRSNDYFVNFVKSRSLRWSIPWWSIPSFSETYSSNPSKGLFFMG